MIALSILYWIKFVVVIVYALVIPPPKMKEVTDKQVDDLIKLKWGYLVSNPRGPTYTSNTALGKVFGVSGSRIR